MRDETRFLSSRGRPFSRAIDRPRAIWKIPGERMKMDEDHSVPLSDPALAVLDKVRDRSQSELIFPSVGAEPF